MNVFDAHVLSRGNLTVLDVAGGPALDFSGRGVTAPVRQAIGRRPKVVVGVRPHKVRLGTGPFAAKIVSNQWLGDQSHVAADVAGKLMVGVSSTRVRAKLGESIPYDIAPEDLHVFDAENGVALAHGLEPA